MRDFRADDDGVMVLDTQATPVMARDVLARIRAVTDRYAKLLAWSSLLWMTAEGLIAVVAGILANSIALIGFGIDSAVPAMNGRKGLARSPGPAVRSRTSPTASEAPSPTPVSPRPTKSYPATGR